MGDALPPQISEFRVPKGRHILIYGALLIGLMISAGVVGFLVGMSKSRTDRKLITKQVAIPSSSSTSSLNTSVVPMCVPLPKCAYTEPICPLAPLVNGAYCLPPTNTPSNKMTLSPTPTLNPIMANWQVYTDLKYGFSFRYPSNWTQDSGEFDPPNTALSFTVNGGNPKMDRVSMVFSIKTNAKNWTSDQWLADIIRRNNSPEMQNTPVTVSGYPGIRNTQTIAFEEYDFIGPVQNLTKQNAEYILFFSNIGEGESNPYPLSDPFLQQSNANFELVVSSFRIPK